MRIDIYTPRPSQLRSNIIEAVRENELETWELRTTADNKIRLTPTSGQYQDVVLLKLGIFEDRGILRVTCKYWRGNEEPSDAVKAIVLGMFTAALLTHFKPQFTYLKTY